MARSLTESPALLSLHSTGDGQYLVRISDTRRRALITGLSKLLADEGATVITMVLPNDIKVFTVNGGSNGTAVNSVAPSSGYGSVAADDRDSDLESGPPVTDPEMLAAIAREEGKPLPNAAVDPDEAEVEVVAPKARRRPKPQSVSGHADTCGRCAGKGHIQMLLDGGHQGSTPCPVCKGEGTITRYGVRR